MLFGDNLRIEENSEIKIKLIKEGRITYVAEDRYH